MYARSPFFNYTVNLKSSFSPQHTTRRDELRVLSEVMCQSTKVKHDLCFSRHLLNSVRFLAQTIPVCVLHYRMLRARSVSYDVVRATADRSLCFLLVEH